VIEVKKSSVWVCELVGARAGVRRYGESVEKTPHIDNELLELFDVQSLHGKIFLTQEEALVVGGESCQCLGFQASGALDALQ